MSRPSVETVLTLLEDACQNGRLQFGGPKGYFDPVGIPAEINLLRARPYGRLNQFEQILEGGPKLQSK